MATFSSSSLDSNWNRLLNFLSGHKVHENSPPPYLLKFRSNRYFIIGAVCVAIFTDIFLYGIIVPVIPYSLTSRIDVEESSVQHWVSVLLAVYGAALCAGAPIVGYYADQTTSRRLPLLIGLLSLAGATIMLCLARTIGLFILGRILQGFSAAVVWTVGQALLVDTVGEKDIGQIAGWVSISMSLAILIAPLLGGVVYERLGYYPVYYMAFGLIVLDVMLRLVLVEKKIARQWEEGREEDSKRAHSALGMVGDKVESRSNVASDTELPRADDAAEKDLQFSGPQQTMRSTSKVPPMFQLITSARLLAALWCTVVQGSLMTAFDAVLPLFVQNTFHWTSTNAGLIFLAIYIPNFVAPAVGALSDRFGPRYLVSLGFVLAIPPWAALRFVYHNSMEQKVLLGLILALIGVTLTMAMTPLMAEITYVVEAKEKKNPGIYGTAGVYGQAYALFIMAFALGTLIGPLWAGFVNQHHGWGTMGWSLSILSGAGAVPAFVWTGGFIMDDNARGAERSKNGKEQAAA